MPVSAVKKSQATDNRLRNEGLDSIPATKEWTLLNSITSVKKFFNIFCSFGMTLRKKTQGIFSPFYWMLVPTLGPEVILVWKLMYIIKLKWSLQGGGTMLSFAISPAKNWGHLGPPETKSELIFGPNLMIFWHLE